MEDVIGPLRDFHRLHIEPMIGRPTGASASEVAELAATLGETLPEAYVQFLLWMGKDYSGVYRGTDIFITDVLNNTAALPEFLEEHGIAPPSGRYVCYQSHQGYFMAWFLLPAVSADPAVFVFREGQNSNEPIAAGSFCSYTLTELRDLANVLTGSRASAQRKSLLSKIRDFLVRRR